MYFALGKGATHLAGGKKNRANDSVGPAKWVQPNINLINLSNYDILLTRIEFFILCLIHEKENWMALDY